MDRFSEFRKRINYLMKFIKYLLFVTNIIFAIISSIMISAATTLITKYGYINWSLNTINTLSCLWIATGSSLLILSLFGIAGTVKESTAMINSYGVFLSLVFCLQMVGTVISFVLMTNARYIVSHCLDTLMWVIGVDNSFGISTDSFAISHMNWVQKTFKCCGNEEPSDWNKIFHPNMGFKVPISCCPEDSYYDNVNMTCDYFTKGCHEPLFQILSEILLTIFSSSIIIGVVQIFGIICAFIYGRTIRQKKTIRDIERWTTTHNTIVSEKPKSVQLLSDEAYIPHR